MKTLKSPFGTCAVFLAALALAVFAQAGGQTRGRPRPHHAISTAAPAPTPHRAQPRFKMDCTLPELTTEPLAIDKVCPNRGSSGANSDSGKQNLMKNRFCLPGSPTTSI